jgi:FKBP-type peptidyl-prolyl cis-trans isomerase
MRNNVFVFAFAFLVVACATTTRETPNGMKYQVLVQGNGILPKPGEVSVFDFVLTDSKDSIWGQTYESGLPAAVMIQDTAAIASEDGMMQMLRELSKGDSVQVKFTMQDFFRTIARGPIPPGIDSTLSLTYRLKVNEIMARDSFITYQNRLAEQKRREQFEKDIVTIDAYLTEKNITAQQTASGIRYVITTEGTGELISSGQTVNVHYAGRLLTGEYFDTSMKAVAEAQGMYEDGRPYEPLEVTVDQSSLIQGWHDAIKVLKKGSKATVYIPSTLAYGPQSRGPVIKPNSILVFDLEVY